MRKQILAWLCVGTLGSPSSAATTDSSTSSTSFFRENDQESQQRQRRQQLELQLMQENRQPPPSDLTGYGGDPDLSYFPLQVCEGDCDSDEDCDVGLICFQREAFQEVPGCNGGEQEDSMTDYCIIDPSLSTTYPPTTSPPTLAPTAIPTSIMLPVPDASSPVTATAPQPTAAATTSNVLQVVGNNGEPPEAFPLQQCQGDCDSDRDCDWGLYCVQRDSDSDTVPGCIMAGMDITDRDFCAPLPEDQWVPGSFRLKLYWEEGYMWQESPLESFWCVTRSYEGVDKKERCWYGLDLEKCQEDQLYIATCSSSDIRQGFVFLPTTISGNAEILIQVAAPPSDGMYVNQCLQRDGTQIYLQTCDETIAEQRFFAPNGSFADGDKFELSQIGRESQCVSNDHHPKAGEVLETHSCEGIRAPESQTSYWVKY